MGLAHQNRTIAIASDFRVDGAKSPEIPQKEGVLDSEIAARNRRSLATFHRTLKSQCSIAFSCLTKLLTKLARAGTFRGDATSSHKGPIAQSKEKYRRGGTPLTKKRFGTTLGVPDTRICPRCREVIPERNFLS